MADRIAKMVGIEVDFRIIPFRGEYFKLPDFYGDRVSHLIYPIPDPDLPFLGVHLTRMIDGGITVGPNAVLGLKREGYGGLNISPKDMLEIFGFPGFWKMFRNNFSAGIVEFRDSLYKPGYLKRVRKYCPEVELDELMSYPAGIRAQAVLNDGTLVHDFLFASSERSLHVCNAPSPAATSALPIADYLAGKARETFSL
jgi:L-2-hydroxyglutarate oxidase